MEALKSKSTGRREVTAGTREWADHNVNCIKGCANDCRYCYAKIIAKRFGRCTEETWKEMVINNRVLERAFGKYSGRVMFPSSHDIVDVPDVKEACLMVIHRLLRAENDLLITTKPRLSVTRDIITRFRSFRPQIQFRFTITSLDDGLISFWEPNAPLFEERFESLRYAYERGFRTSVSIEPFLDYDPSELVRVVLPYVTESVWIGPMNYIPQSGISEEVRQQYAKIRERYTIHRLQQVFEGLKGCPRLRFKDSMLIKLSAYQHGNTRNTRP